MGQWVDGRAWRDSCVGPEAVSYPPEPAAGPRARPDTPNGSPAPQSPRGTSVDGRDSYVCPKVVSSLRCFGAGLKRLPFARQNGVDAAEEVPEGDSDDECEEAEEDEEDEEDEEEDDDEDGVGPGRKLSEFGELCRSFRRSIRLESRPGSTVRSGRARRVTLDPEARFISPRSGQSSPRSPSLDSSRLSPLMHVDGLAAPPKVATRRISFGGTSEASEMSDTSEVSDAARRLSGFDELTLSFPVAPGNADGNKRSVPAARDAVPLCHLQPYSFRPHRYPSTPKTRIRMC